MIKEILKSTLAVLPGGVQKRVKRVYRNSRRAKKIKQWRHEGSPVPPPHIVKQAVIDEYRKRTGINTLVETGTYYGDMVMAQIDNFTKIYSIELGVDLWLGAKKRFEPYLHIEILQGDSGKILIELVPKLEGPALFWLDGHYSAGVTALGEKVCPVFEELDAIFADGSIPHVLLIDDARLFRGDGNYPTITSLEQYVLGKNSVYSMEVKDDVIRFTKRK